MTSDELDAIHQMAVDLAIADDRLTRAMAGSDDIGTPDAIRHYDAAISAIATAQLPALPSNHLAATLVDAMAKLQDLPAGEDEASLTIQGLVVAEIQDALDTFRSRTGEARRAAALKRRSTT
jgi:hypothetical protein